LFLKSVEIHGFKSFAEKTTLQFKPGVTAIVGPNGCGKSNIIDAIRWVLGESSARSLRGEVMDDVIFSGSEDRKPLGMAEVGITIANEDGLLPVEYSEVNIKRRLYRSGESEFLINKNNVRQKDIHDLFADTGIGKKSYSVMEQGNIDVILSNRPEERITVFEEAAGITRYKTRIKQSYKKLATTRENLVRLDLIIHEVEKEYKSLEKQAQKAILYKKVKKDEINYETLYNYERINKLKGQIDKNISMLSDLKTKRDVCTKETTELNETIKKNIDNVRDIENEIGDIKNEVYRKEAEIEAANSKISHIKDRIFEIQNEIDKKILNIEKIKKNKQDLGLKLDRLTKDYKGVEELISEQKDKLDNYLKEADYINKNIDRSTSKLTENSKKIEVTEATLMGLREDLRNVINRLLKEIDAIKAGFEGNEKRKNELVADISDDIQKIDSGLKHCMTRIDDLVYTADESDLRGYTENLSDQVISIRERLQSLKSNVQMVIDIQDDLSKVIFGKESSHTRKEQIERSIEKHLNIIEALKTEIIELNEGLKKGREKKEEFEKLINNLRLDMTRNREKFNYYEETITRLKKDLEKSEESQQDVEFEIKSQRERIEQFETEIKKLETGSRKLENNKTALAEKMKGHNSLIKKIINSMRKSETALNRKRNQLESIMKSIEKLELNNAELKSKVDTIIENFRERYSITLELFKPEKEIDIKIINEERERIKRELSSIGQVNLIAIEEFKEVKKRYEYLTEQKRDLEKAKEDINVIVSKTIDTSKEMFMETFEKIKSNFNGLFRRLFNGGRTDLFLTDDSNIFESGVDIYACPPGKTLKRKSLLSGGEKSLTAISLLFAVFMVKASPFCMLDEVDHDLDEENIVRFLRLLKEFTDTTQFLIITHNRRTIEFADILYGVTSEEAGISKVVSLDMMEQAVE
jgi:chromosome segregation protein